MNYKYSRKEYSRNIKTAIALSLLITIIIFILIPPVEPEKKSSSAVENAIINLIPIPHTVQREEVFSKRPVKVNLNFGLTSEELDLLDDVQISYSDSVNKEHVDAKNIIRARIYVTPFQISEVVPPENINAKGRLLLKIWIDYKGKPVKSEIVSSTLSPSEATQTVVEMAMKSEWLVEYPSTDSLYIVFKEYNFN
jgi:hypothetical protein